MLLLDIGAPSVIEALDFESIKARKLARHIELMKEKGIEYVPSESDDVMTSIERSAYDEMLLRAQINAKVKSQLLLYAMDEDLDHIGVTRYGEERLKGAMPYAAYTFELSAAQAADVTLSAGLQLTDGNGAEAKLLDDVVITAGNLTGTGTVELQEYTESSDVTVETIVTPLPYVVSATQDETFHDGADAEENERYRERIWLSRNKKSTAGATGTYEYFAKTADARVKAVKVLQISGGVVGVYLLADTGTADQVMIDRVDAALAPETVRPLTDDPQVQSAGVVTLNLEADLVLYDLTYEAAVRELIATRLAENTMIFGKSLSAAKIYGILESDQVKDATIVSALPPALEAHQVLQLGTLTLNITGAA